MKSCVHFAKSKCEFEVGCMCIERSEEKCHVGIQVAFAQVPRGKNITRGRQIIQLTVKC